jgi:hypothetical protein
MENPLQRLNPTGRDQDFGVNADRQFLGIDNGYRYPLRIFTSVAMIAGGRFGCFRNAGTAMFPPLVWVESRVESGHKRPRTAMAGGID